MSRPTQIIIDLAALHHNFERIQQIAPGCAVMAMVKANAYGHGLERIARALPQAEALSVASMEEGIHLRKAGILRPIVLMEGLFYADELSDAIYHDFTLVIHHRKHVEMIEKNISEKSFSIWLKVDTGMHRLGFSPAEVNEMYQRLMRCPNVKKPLGIMTHFAQAEALDPAFTAQQIALFNATTAHFIGPRSLANSAAILAWPASHGDWIRPGLILYGASPFANKTGVDHALQPVMTLQSQLIAIRQVQKGDSVGYGCTWTAPEEIPIGVVGVGYGDGYPQHAQNGTPVLVNGKICPLVGRVSMDMLTVDLRSQREAQIGAPVVLWGAGLPVEQVAASSRTSAYELLTRMTQRPKIEIRE